MIHCRRDGALGGLDDVMHTDPVMPLGEDLRWRRHLLVHQREHVRGAMPPNGIGDRGV